MKVITWNINSVRLRMPLLQKLSQLQQADVICLQETKVADELFPLKALENLGYPYIHFRGQKSYNGVAILSKVPFQNTSHLDVAGSDDSRHISVQFVNGIELHNFYVPAGGDEPDIDVNPKYKFKLAFLDDMTAWFGANRNPSDKVIIVGDFNVAPYEHDVWSHKQLLKVVSHTPPETERLRNLKDTLDWVDVGRQFVPMDKKLYSWWSYRNRDWKKSNRGRRLDHIWTTPSMKSDITSYYVLNEARDWKQPSDHAPVIMEVAV